MNPFKNRLIAGTSVYAVNVVFTRSSRTMMTLLIICIDGCVVAMYWTVRSSKDVFLLVSTLITIKVKLTLLIVIFRAEKFGGPGDLT
jgi:hypothetical protein